jgi:hypothetical protein
VQDKEQLNLTDEDSRIMKVAGGGFDQCYNAQAVAAAGSMIIVATDVTQAANDKGQLLPMINRLQGLPKELGRAKRIHTDNGYFSDRNLEQCAAVKIKPLIATGRTLHHVSWKQRFAAAPKIPAESATALQKAAYRLKTPRGRNLSRCASKPPNRCSASSNR